MCIEQNIGEILKKVETSAIKSNRDPKDITVIAVTKTVDSIRAKEAVVAGLNNLGENRVQEFLSKYEKLQDEKINWHIIGHLQTNKVKYVIDKNCLIHSLESIELAREIDKRAKQHDLIAKVLVEMNIAEEESKFGIKKQKVVDFFREIEYFENIEIVGLMTVAPFDECSENIRWVFREMKELFEYIKSFKFKNANMKYLSMGMSNDYEIAIEEGANIIRVGTAIFGSRIYK